MIGGRRLLGVGTLVLAVLGAAAAAHLAGSGIPGTATPVPVAGAPAVGDCLTTRSTTPTLFGQGAGHYPTLALAPCPGPRFGEVAAVLPGPAAADPAGSGTTGASGGATTTERSGAATTPVGQSPDPARNRCAQAGRAYLGEDTLSADVLARWRPAVRVQTTPAAPSPRQRAAGQTWIACVLWIPASWDGAGALAGSAHRLLLTGAGADQLGNCVAGLTWSDVEPFSCAAAHHTEVLGVSTGQGPTPRDTAQRSCLDLGRQLMRTPDPTAGGRLRLRVMGSAGVDPPATMTGTVFCVVQTTGDDVLAGGLLGLGDRPVPWA